MILTKYVVKSLNREQDRIDNESIKYWEEYDPATDPRLDDEGTYDYYATPMPPNSSRWYDDYVCKCDNCGKYRRVYRTDVGYFYTYDGYDSMSWTECWKCVLDRKIYRYKHNIRKYFNFK